MLEKQYHSKKRTCPGHGIAFFQISKAMVIFLIVFPLLAVVLVPAPVFAEGVIGLDRTFTINTINFLTSNPEYAQAFNYFFTIELLVGLFAFWVRITIRPFRM